MAEPQVVAQQVFDECNERLDDMINKLVVLARGQGAHELIAPDLLKMKNSFMPPKMSEYMLAHLAATAVLRLVNDELMDADELPNT